MVKLQIILITTKLQYGNTWMLFAQKLQVAKFNYVTLVIVTTLNRLRDHF